MTKPPVGVTRGERALATRVHGAAAQAVSLSGAAAPPPSVLRAEARAMLAEALPLVQQRFVQGTLNKDDVAYVRMLASIGVGERVAAGGLDGELRRRGAVVLLPPRQERAIPAPGPVPGSVPGSVPGPGGLPSSEG